MSKKKLNTNGTLLNLLLLGGAAVILKKRTGSLRGVGATLKRYYYYFMDDDYNVYDTCPIPDGVTKARAVKIAKQWMAENGFTSGYVVVNSMATGNILDQIEIEL